MRFGKVFVIVIAVSVAGWLVWQRVQPMPRASANISVENPKDVIVVNMLQDEYMPSEVRIKAGQSVRFVNQSNDWRWPASNLHPTHDIYPEFDPKEPIQPKGEWTFRFDKAGQWRMHDHLAPYITGTVFVSD